MLLWKTLGIAAAVAGIGAGAAGVALYGNKCLSITEYTVSLPTLPESFSGMRLVHLSDLHAASFGDGQLHLLHAIDTLRPEQVLITGDLIDRRRTKTRHDMEPALCLLRALADKYPTMRVDGNHEVRSCVGQEFVKLAALTGVKDVTGTCLSLRRGEEEITVVGIPDVAVFQDDDDAWAQHMHTVCAPYKDTFVLALSHRPQYLSAYAAEGLPLVLCGHAHGGQWRLPFIRGLYAPEQGVFPRYTQGVHQEGDTRMVISRGLGNSGFPMRLFNRPEIVVITLKKA